MYKTVKEKGRITELGYQDEKTLLLWIAGAVKREKKKIQESTARHLLSKVGTDMENLEKSWRSCFLILLLRKKLLWKMWTQSARHRSQTIF